MNKILEFVFRDRGRQIILSSIMFLFAIAIVFFGINANSILGDEGYMALSCKNYENSPLAMMIFYLGDLWMNVFGDTFLSLRVLCRVCILVATGVGLMYLWSQTHNLLLTAIIGLTTALFSNLGDAGFYNWDTGAYPVEAVGTILLMSYVSYPSTRNLILLGLVGGIMTAFRVPLVLFSALILIAIVGSSTNKIICIELLVGGVSFLSGWLVCVLLMTGSVSAYIASFRSENIVTGHSATFLQPYIDQFVRYFPRLVYFAVSTLVACLMGLVLSYWRNVKIKEILFCDFVLLIIAFSFCVAYISTNGTTMPGIGIPLFLMFILWPEIGHNWGGIVDAQNKHLRLKSVLLFLMMLLEGFGSDTFFYRWTMVFLLPVAVGVVWPNTTVKAKRAFKLVLIILIPFLAVLVPIKNKLVVSDAERLANSEKSRITGIYVAPKTAQTYRSLAREVNDLTKLNLKFSFIGYPMRYMYTYEFVNDYSNESLFHCYHFSDISTQGIRELAGANDAIIVIGEFPKTVKYLLDKCNYTMIKSTSEFTILKSMDSAISQRK